jgi:hypothetical protein
MWFADFHQFPRDPLVPFGRAFYSIFEFAADVRQSLGHFTRTASDVATTGAAELYDLTNPNFVV